MCRTVRTNFGYPILVIKKIDERVVQKQRKLRIQFTLIVINIHCFLFALKKKELCFNSQKILNTAEQFN